MISQECYELGSKSSVIREIFSYGLKRKAEIGEDKVYDFSLGNPSIPAPESVKKAILELMELPPEKVHAYSPAPGDPKVRTAIADSLNRRFGESFRMENIFMTCGAASFPEYLSESPAKRRRRSHYLCAVLPGVSCLGRGRGCYPECNSGEAAGFPD